MRKGHIAFLGHPTHPFVGPLLTIVAVLARRGYRVTYAVTEKFAERAIAAGAEVISVHDVPELSDPRVCYFDALKRVTLATLGTAFPFYEKDRPQLIAYDWPALAGRVLSTRLRIPAIQTSVAFSQDKHVHGAQLADSAFVKENHDLAAKADDLLHQLGVSRSNYSYLFSREKLNIYLFPKMFQPCADMIDQAYIYAGRCAGEQSYYGKWQRGVYGSKKVILIATSTYYIQGPEFFKLCLAAFSDQGWHLILSIGEAANARALEPLPPNCEIVQRTSHVAILPYVDLMVCLGGISTSCEAAYHGVPLLVTSHGFPELEWQAENLVRVGICIHLKKAGMNQQSLKEAAARILQDRTILTRVQEVRRIVQREPGAEEASNHIESFLETLRGN